MDDNNTANPTNRTGLVIAQLIFLSITVLDVYLLVTKAGMLPKLLAGGSFIFALGLLGVSYKRTNPTQK